MELSESKKIAIEMCTEKGFNPSDMLDIIVELLDKIDELENKILELNLNKEF